MKAALRTVGGVLWETAATLRKRGVTIDAQLKLLPRAGEPLENPKTTVVAPTLLVGADEVIG